jgi:hypothetical protein
MRRYIKVAAEIEVNKTLFHPIQSHEANATLARIYP